MKKTQLTRRQFVKAAALGTASTLALPHFFPAAALGKDGIVAPSERITLAGIGIHNRGSYVLSRMLVQPDVQFVAICDVRADQREKIKAVADEKYGNNDCATYRDMRELLARDDIDAVLIATGDRWHTLASTMAAKAGKDVYSEKPCAISIGQCRDLDEAMKRYGTVFQAGTQRRDVENFRFAINLARSGKLGKIHTLHASIYHLQVRYDWLPTQPEPSKDVLDWNLWLGPAPWRPYNFDYCAGNYCQWRAHFDFDSGAKLLDWGAHTVDLCQWANNSDDTVPVEYEAKGNSIYAQYADGVKLIMRPDGWLGLGTCPIRIEGDEGWIETGDSGKFAVSSPTLLQNSPPPVNGLDAEPHVRNFFNCVKSRQQPSTNASIARHSHIACHAAALSWMLGRKLQFDPVKEEFIGDEEANRMRTRAMRNPWKDA